MRCTGTTWVLRAQLRVPASMITASGAMDQLLSTLIRQSQLSAPKLTIASCSQRAVHHAGADANF